MEMKAEFIKWNDESMDENGRELSVEVKGLKCKGFFFVQFPSICYNFNHALPEGMRMAWVEVYEGELLNIYCTSIEDHSIKTGFIRVRPV
jgi:hypothetical protein